VIVVSLELFAALQYGAPFGYGEWAAIAAWYGLGNMIGGVVLVTTLRMIQIGRRIDEGRQSTRQPATGSPRSEDSTEYQARDAGSWDE